MWKASANCGKELFNFGKVVLDLGEFLDVVLVYLGDHLRDSLERREAGFTFE